MQPTRASWTFRSETVWRSEDGPCRSPAGLVGVGAASVSATATLPTPSFPAPTGNPESRQPPPAMHDARPVALTVCRLGGRRCRLRSAVSGLWIPAYAGMTALVGGRAIPTPASPSGSCRAATEGVLATLRAPKPPPPAKRRVNPDLAPQVRSGCPGGFTRPEGRGCVRQSRVRVALGDVRAVFHRPHPQRETDRGALRSIQRFLTEAGRGPDLAT